MTLHANRFGPFQPLLLGVLSLVTASGCGSRSALDESDAGLYPGISLGDGTENPGGDEPLEDGGIAEGGPGSSFPDGSTGFGPVCRDFLEMFNETSDTSACLACITKAQKGACYAEYLAATDYDEPCGMPNDCASINCSCSLTTCRPGICACIQGCMRSAPSECIDRWTSYWACVGRACDSGC